MMIECVNEGGWRLVALVVCTSYGRVGRVEGH